MPSSIIIQAARRCVNAGEHKLETRIETTANRTLLAVIAVGGLIVAAIKLFP